MKEYQFSVNYTCDMFGEDCQEDHHVIQVVKAESILEGYKQLESKFSNAIYIVFLGEI